MEKNRAVLILRYEDQKLLEKIQKEYKLSAVYDNLDAADIEYLEEFITNELIEEEEEEE